MLSRTHPRKVGFWDSGKGRPLSNPFEVVRTDGDRWFCGVKKAAIAGGLLNVAGLALVSRDLQSLRLDRAGVANINQEFR